ncbi:MAG: acyl-CoA dehydratase activase [Deltaproteobacteria bacterium]|nr:acyl-CoA dehydratase activase [Deltaproteobacteria bacterium]
MSDDYYWGIDLGSSAIKVVLITSKGEIINKSKGKTLFPLIKQVRNLLNSSDFPESPFSEPASDTDEQIKINHFIASTGYGRNHIPFTHNKLTEIKAHFLGIQFLYKNESDFSLIDIGGQDSKIIKIKDHQILDFVINRKCAAGTGAFLDEICHRLDIRLKDLPSLATKHDKKLNLGSYCTVFAVQEMIKILVSGEKIENLAHALYTSITKRVLEITSIESGKVIFSGGVMQHHPILLNYFNDNLSEHELFLAKDAQFSGAFGAALSLT